MVGEYPLREGMVGEYPLMEGMVGEYPVEAGPRLRRERHRAISLVPSKVLLRDFSCCRRDVR